MAIFLIYAHTDPVMTARLCAALRPNKVFLHIDLKSDIELFTSELSKVDSNHVSLTNMRVRVNWAGFSQVRAMRILIDAAAGNALPEEHMIMLSGQDYPIKPISLFTDFLKENSNVQFIKCFDISKSTPQYVNHISRRHNRDINILGPYSERGKKIRNFIIRAADALTVKKIPDPPRNLRIMHGQTHWALTTECAVELNASVTPKMVNFFRFCFASDEKFFHTLVANSRFADNRGGRGEVPYAGSGNWRYTNFHHVDPSLKKIYELGDWNEIANSESYFVRKVESQKSKHLLDKIDSDLLLDTENK